MSSTTATSSTPRRRRAPAAPAVPLGSLTQRPHQATTGCPSCGSASVTTLTMTLTDGTPARFSSCRSCDHRHWTSEDGELSIADVLVRATKP